MLYRVQKRDIIPASKVLADAFRYDPLWNKVYEGEPYTGKRFRAFFEVPVRYCMKYGEVYAPSEDLEGVMGLVPGKYADMDMWHIILCGAIGATMRMGLNAAKKMGPIGKTLIKDRHENMASCDYLYLQVLGVDTELQGRGFGRILLDAVIEKSERAELQIYLETETEENMKMYEHFGFMLLNKITLPIVDVPMWEMVRKPDL